MRSYIFTENERNVLIEWLKSGRRTEATNLLIFNIEKNYRPLITDSKLLIMAIKKYNAGY